MQKENAGQYIKRLVLRSGILGKLIAANTIVFLFFVVLQVVEKITVQPGLSDAVKVHFIAPGTFAEVIYKPWSIITHMFTHQGFSHFLFNMLVLYFSGRIFMQFFSGRRLLATYFLGGIFAYLIHVVSYIIFPMYQDVLPPGVLGASASIMAIFIAVAVYQPSYTIRLLGVFPIQLFILAALYVVTDLLGVGSEGKVAHIAHLGGALFGGLSIINANSPKNFMNRFDRFIFKLKLSNNPFKRKPKKAKMKLHRQDKVRNMTDDEYNSERTENKERIDAILDKISKRGYDGLTKEEKQILFNESKRK